MLAFEEATAISLNGDPVALDICGYYMDQDIHTVQLPKLKAGVNTLRVSVPIGNRDRLEPMYLLGDFSVTLRDTDSFEVQTRKNMITEVTTGEAVCAMMRTPNMTRWYP